MYSFYRDLEIWRRYALEIHSRYFKRQDIYTYLNTLVEKTGHKRIADKNRNNNKILEIGVGGGEHVRYELPLNEQKQYYAIDINLEHVKITRSQYSIRALNADGAYLPFKKNTFDSCVAIGVLEHIVELDKSLSGIGEALKKNGDFFVVIPTNGSLCISLFRLLVSYPSMHSRGIKKPGYIWNYENVNNFTRIMCFLEKHFIILEKHPIPFRYIPWNMSPLYFLHCKNNRFNAKHGFML